MCVYTHTEGQNGKRQKPTPGNTEPNTGWAHCFRLNFLKTNIQWKTDKL